MKTATLIETKRGFGGDSYTYQTDDGKTIVCSLGFGLMCPPQISLHFGGVLFMERYTTYDDWAEMIVQGRYAMKQAGYELDSMPVMEGV